MRSIDYIQEHKPRFLQELFDFLKIPSIGGKQAHQADTRKAAEYVKDQLLRAGADNAYLIPTKGQPLVYGEKKIDKALPTILVYGHYDVQPVDPLELWDHPPFEPMIKNGKIYARGAADDKGQLFAHIKGLETMTATKQIPCNLRYLIEGEEEIGSPTLQGFVKDKALLDHINPEQIDVLLLSDTSMPSMEQPVIPLGMRGIIILDITMQGPNRDLHSGMYGGAVQNPIQALCALLAQLEDEKGRIQIPGFYDQVLELDKHERSLLSQAPFDAKAYKKDLGINEVVGERGYTIPERVGIRPTLTVNGIWGGYTGDGVKTVLPAKAHAKMSIRLVPQQDPEQIKQACKKHLISLAPKGTRVSVTLHPGGSGALVVPSDFKGIQAAAKALKEVWQKPPTFVREGGSIPILSTMQQALPRADIVLMGFGLDSDNIHSPNESFGVENYLKGIEAVVAFHRHYATSVR